LTVVGLLQGNGGVGPMQPKLFPRSLRVKKEGTGDGKSFKQAAKEDTAGFKRFKGKKRKRG